LITVVVTNPSEDAVTFETGGPPFQVTADPAQSKGLAASSRIASSTESLNAGPGLDSWDGRVSQIHQCTLVSGRWSAGDGARPGGG
jgi:hypothetical protein